MAPPQYMPMRPLTKVLTAHRKIAQQHIHPARRAVQDTARASNPMQVKQTQARIVRQMQVRQMAVRMVKPQIAAAQDSNPIPMRQDKQLQVIHPARRAARASNPMQAK